MSQNITSLDQLPDDPTSPEAHQMVLEQCAGNPEGAQMAAYMSGYFDAEGCILISACENKSRAIDYEYSPAVQINTAQQMAGFFDGEGCISVHVSEQSTCSNNHRFRPLVRAHQNDTNTMLEQIFNSYCSLFDVEYNTYERSAQNDNSSPTVEAFVKGEDIDNFLSPLLPLLQEKRRQAFIMVSKILPRYLDGKHLTKEGFIELMKWKKELDREKPMDDEDRKYTVEYFEELWGDEIEAQCSLTEFSGEA